MRQLAAFTAPGLFEEGSAATTMAEIPQGMGFYPNMAGDVVLGHQYSPETADMTSAQVRLHLDNLMHTIAVGDTGFGKSVAMIRMAYETTLRWKLHDVLDFGRLAVAHAPRWMVCQHHTVVAGCSASVPLESLQIGEISLLKRSGALCRCIRRIAVA
jgi:hypothetical protein